MLAALVVLAPAMARGEDPIGAPTPEPSSIFNGIDAPLCAFPSAVAMLDVETEGMFCSGTLIHPEVILFAAHCMDPDSSWATPGSVMFGEDVHAPFRTVPVDRCGMHPNWKDDGIDLAVCTLKAPVRDVPVVPLLMGCEVEQLQPGRGVTIVGFGATSGIQQPEGGVDTSGSGLKRFTHQTITDVKINRNDVVMIGPNTGACFGDSGGPAMIQLLDGTWRVFGAASTLHPDFSPDPNTGELCGLGTVYEIVWNHVDWLEAFTEHDLTPCHTADGTWKPSAGCGGFPFFPGESASTWFDACDTDQVGTWSGTCGAPFSTGVFPSPNPTPTPPDPPPPDPPPPPPPPPPEPDPTLPTDTGIDPTVSFETETDSDTETETDPGQDDAGGEKGCSCRSSEPTPLALGLLGLLALRRRRR